MVDLSGPRAQEEGAFPWDHSTRTSTSFMKVCVAGTGPQAAFTLSHLILMKPQEVWVPAFPR